MNQSSSRGASFAGSADVPSALSARRESYSGEEFEKRGARYARGGRDVRAPGFTRLVELKLNQCSHEATEVSHSHLRYGVSTARVSGWVRHSIRELIVGPTR